MQEHERSGAAFTITTIPVDKQKTKSLSIVKLDSLDSKTINQFVEKPQDEAFIDSCVIPEFALSMFIIACSSKVQLLPFNSF